MNDYLLKSLMRQRHEQILNEVNAARFMQPERPCASSGTKVTGVVRYLYRLWKRLITYRMLAVGERKCK